MSVLIRRLKEDDLVEGFDCKDHALNNYLKRHAWTNQQKVSIGVTYVAVDQTAVGVVLGYFTLAASAIHPSNLPEQYVRGLPAYDVPLILLARLAVDYRWTGKGLGHALIAEALKICLNVGELVGCRYVVTEAYRNSTSWHARYGFVPLERNSEDKATQRMGLDLRVLKAAQ